MSRRSTLAAIKHHSADRLAKLRIENLERELDRKRQEELGRWTYPHMCRDRHPEIGHMDSEHELCPLCRALNVIQQGIDDCNEGAPKAVIALRLLNGLEGLRHE